MYINCSDGDIRLIGGNTDNEGNVQICYNNAWGSVCDDYWGIADSNVVCRQLGFQPYGTTYLHHYIKSLFSGSHKYYYHNHFGVSNSPPYLYGTFSCSGSENSLINCSKSYSSLLNCENNEIAGVHCEGKINYFCFKAIYIFVIALIVVVQTVDDNLN